MKSRIVKPFQEMPDCFSPRITSDNEIIIVDFYGKPIQHKDLLELKEYINKSCKEMTPEKIQDHVYEWETRMEENKKRHSSNSARIRQKVKGCIYVLKMSDSLFKIGRTKDFKSRIGNYKTHTTAKIEVVCLINSDDIAQDEAELHHRFLDKRVDNREYFFLNDADIEYLKSLVLSRGDT